MYCWASSGATRRARLPMTTPSSAANSTCCACGGSSIASPGPMTDVPGLMNSSGSGGARPPHHFARLARGQQPHLAQGRHPPAARELAENVPGDGPNAVPVQITRVDLFVFLVADDLHETSEDRKSTRL